ncbi:hypothetical protein EHQ61_10585 [Leptospira wolffii]|uniref:hypothetical protein n=1 Tax=Leptospira wolffii TaxID=409998 RepID=UPI0010847B8E|nr:hypothetical protein [Leptospira wolffii]TGL49758.1 hypothetical protein EHQ61_10585 [Leptospira wolffii]
MSEKEIFSINTEKHGRLGFAKQTVGRYLDVKTPLRSPLALTEKDIVKNLSHFLLLSVGNEIWDIKRIRENREEFNKIALSLNENEIIDFSVKYLERNPSLLGGKDSSQIKINGQYVETNYDSEDIREFEKLKLINDPIERLGKAYKYEFLRNIKSMKNATGMSSSWLKLISPGDAASFVEKRSALDYLQLPPAVDEIADVRKKENNELIELLKAEAEYSKESTRIFQKIYEFQLNTAEKQSKSAKRQSNLAIFIAIASIIISTIVGVVGIYYAKSSLDFSISEARKSKVEDILREIESNQRKKNRM